MLVEGMHELTGGLWPSSGHFHGVPCAQRYLPKGRQFVVRARGVGEVRSVHLLAFVSLTTFPTRKRSSFVLMIIYMLDHHGKKGRVEKPLWRFERKLPF